VVLVAFPVAEAEELAPADGEASEVEIVAVVGATRGEELLVGGADTALVGATVAAVSAPAVVAAAVPFAEPVPDWPLTSGDSASARRASECIMLQRSV